MEYNKKMANTEIDSEQSKIDVNVLENLHKTPISGAVKELLVDMLDGTPLNSLSEDINQSAINENEDNDMDSPVKKSRKRLQRLYDSGTSEDEGEDFRKNCELREDPENGKIVDGITEDKSDYALMRSRLKALCDSESSEDEREFQDVFVGTELIANPNIKGMKSVKPKEKKMTAKEYEEQKLEIKSESQRMQRERNVSMPYHRPKARSLKEFLEKRPKFTAAISENNGKTPPILAIKMTNQNLEKISKKLQEREKILETFYKSESESDDENLKTDSKIDKLKPTEEILNTLNVGYNDNVIDEEIIANNIDNSEKTQTIEIISNILIPEKLPNNDSADYEFSLENTDLSENITDSVNIEENPCMENDEKQQSKKSLNLLQLFKESLGDFAPKLSGEPNDVINFNTEMETANKETAGVDKLIERFIKHSTRKIASKDDSVQVDILTISGGELHKEVVTMQLQPSDEPMVVSETPGAKLQKLRTDLQSQMALRRSEMWKRKNVLSSKAPTDGAANDGKEHGEYDILDDEEEEEDEFDVEEEEEEEELEENDVDMREKSRDGVKNGFIEDEAELSETDAPDNEDDEEDDTLDNMVEENPVKKKLRRILTIADDSDDEDENSANLIIHPANSKPICKGPLDSTDPWEDEDDSDSQLLPNAQRPRSRSRTPQLTGTKSSNTFGFVITPVRQLTALQSFENASSDDLDPAVEIGVKNPSPVVPLPPDPSPLRGNLWQRHLLFPECDTAINAEQMVNMEELANEICSGKFPSTISPRNSVINEFDFKNSQPSTQDVLDICSGNFTCATQKNTTSNCEERNSPENNQNFGGKIDLTKSETVDVFKQPIIDCLDDDEDKVISQLLDEEEMEKFKKKFESPLNFDEKLEIPPKSPLCNRIMFDTSDEDENDLNIREKRKILRKKRRKCLIDDSDDDENNTVDNFDDEIDENIDYDSEENEVDTTENKPVFQVNDFVENEAELTESEWDSADEDEKGLDEFDVELGDEEKFDQEKLRSGIERVQLRQMLDEDNKDLKILQEMLLEDGELHGTGRERQFKWRNIDNTFDFNNENNENDEENVEDCTESEETWRKKRHERIQFLQKTKVCQQIESDDLLLSNNTFLKLGQKAIVRNANTSQITTEDPKTINSAVKQPFTLLNKRGSFLSRGEKALAKVAEFSKQHKNSAIGPTKFSRNFLFSTVLHETDENSKKRKTDAGTPTAIKKLRLSNLSPGINRNSAKTSAKKLFALT